MFPPLPPWDGLHPLVIHFPIALLIVAPVLVLIGLVAYRQYLWFGVSALVLMVLGTVGAFVAVSTGEAGAELVMRTADIEAALEQHEELAETAQWVFVGLTLLFAAVLLIPPMIKRPLKRLPGTIVSGVFLLVYAGGLTLLANTAHQGGRLVHEFGVQALLAQSPGSTAPTGEATRHRDVEYEHDDD